jgi:hypothetical protein
MVSLCECSQSDSNFSASVQGVLAQQLQALSPILASSGGVEELFDAKSVRSCQIGVLYVFLINYFLIQILICISDTLPFG